MQTTHISLTDTAKLLRAALKNAFPGIKFSVRSKSYSGGASIRIYWTDGPTQDQVQRISNEFEGADFDGMQDLKSYQAHVVDNEARHYGADYIFPERIHSATHLRKAAAKVAEAFSVPPIAIIEETWGATCDINAMPFADRLLPNGVSRELQHLAGEPFEMAVYQVAHAMTCLAKPRVRIMPRVTIAA